MSETRKCRRVQPALAPEGPLRISARTLSLCLLPHCDADRTDEAEGVLRTVV